MRKHRAALLVAGLACVAVAAAGCTSSAPNPGPAGTSGSSPSVVVSSAPGSPTTSSSGAPSTTTPTTSSSTPADPRVAAALKAYTDFDRAADYAYTHPPKKIGDPLPSAGNFRPFSFDPAQGQILNYVFFLTEGSLEMTGTPPAPRVSVTSIDLSATPYPTVTVSDCPTAPSDWKVIRVGSGSQPVTKTSPGAKPPNLITATVIYYEKRWGVSKLSTDTKRTCTP